MDIRFTFGVALAAAALSLGGCASSPMTPQVQRADAVDAQSRIDKASAVVELMQQQPGMDAVLRNAKAVLVVPDYARAAWIIGGQGGVGVLVARSQGQWSDPAFFTIGGLSIGLQAGGEGGPIAYVLMTPRAVEPFATRMNKFALSADAGLNVVNFSSAASIASTLPSADVVVWTGTKGLFGGVSFGVTDVAVNSTLDEAYYHGLVSVHDILTGTVYNRAGDELGQTLTARVATK